jgi:MerR family transcriptional regulator, light-induced transcriptional regulator
MDDAITIAELASMTGVGEATLRVWEERHGAPRPARLPNGHRRYSVRDVEVVRAAVEHRRGGLSVAAALERARAAGGEPATSIFAAVRESRPELAPLAIDKPTLVRVSHAIEDECAARAIRGLLIGCFQRESFYRRAEPRWRELARGMAVTIVLADFPHRRDRTRKPTEVPFGRRSPLRSEWALIGPAGCLLARERPGGAAGEHRRLFDALWSPEPEVVHAAAGVAVSLVGDDSLAERAVEALGPAPAPSPPELRRAACLTNRIIGYVAAPAG